MTSRVEEVGTISKLILNVGKLRVAHNKYCIASFVIVIVGWY